jgi:hypothetical protein
MDILISFAVPYKASNYVINLEAIGLKEGLC